MAFGSDDEAQRAFDAWLVRHRPPKVRVDTADFEMQHVDWFMENYGRAVDQLYIEFDRLVNLTRQVNCIDKSAWPQHRAMQFVLLAKNQQTFHSAIDRLSKGSYQDAMSLTRSIYETFLRVIHISLNSEHPWGAVSDKPLQGEPKSTQPASSATSCGSIGGRTS